MMAVTAGADPPSGISPQSRSGEVAARTPLPPTTWATLLACGSPPCARTAGPPPPVTRWKPLSAAVTRPGTPACSSTVDSPVIGTGNCGCAPSPGRDSPNRPAAQASTYPVPYAAARLRTTPNTTDEQLGHRMPARTAGPTVQMMPSGAMQARLPATIMTSRTTTGARRRGLLPGYGPGRRPAGPGPGEGHGHEPDPHPAGQPRAR